MSDEVAYKNEGAAAFLLSPLQQILFQLSKSYSTTISLYSLGSRVTHDAIPLTDPFLLARTIPVNVIKGKLIVFCLSQVYFNGYLLLPIYCQCQVLEINNILSICLLVVLVQGNIASSVKPYILYGQFCVYAGKSTRYPSEFLNTYIWAYCSDFVLKSFFSHYHRFQL